MHEIDLEKQFSISQLHAYSNRNELETLFLLSKKKLERSEERNTPTRQIDTRMCQRRRLHARQEIVFAKENSWKASRWRGRKNCRGKTFRMIPFSRLKPPERRRSLWLRPIVVTSTGEKRKRRQGDGK